METGKNKLLYIISLAVLLAGASCINDLDTLPLDQDVVTSEDVYSNPENYKSVLAKLYAGLAVSGQEGPAGNNDLSGLDEGFGQYLRAYWYAQELPTDEAVIAWNDGNLRNYQETNWSSNNEFIANMYYRIFYQISLCNEFLRETTPDKLDERNITGELRNETERYRNEARFLRALSYWHAIDMFGNVPFVTEEDAVGSFFPEQISRADLFTFLENELREIETLLAPPQQIEYGRADQAAAWMLLAKLYLNAEIYTGQDRYTDCITYCNKVIDAGYTLEPEYAHLFLADNHTSDEIIFPITQDGINTRTFGGTSFIIHAAVGGNMDPSEFGIEGGWAGTRATPQFVGKFLAISQIEATRMVVKSTLQYPVIYVPGGYQAAAGYSEGDWSPETAPTLASVNSDDVYEGYIYFPADNSEYKFTPGPNWDVDYGDNNGDGVLDLQGGNLIIPEAGMYRIIVDLNNFSYTAVRTTWAIIGDATPGGWDSDTPMEFNPATRQWQVDVSLSNAAFKFRANNDWAINYGDTGMDGILDFEGDNIPVEVAGRYLITLNLGTPDYTYSVEASATDSRIMFHTNGQTLEIDNPFEFTSGYAVTKWKNITSTGSNGSHLEYTDTDFPVFRLADAYLMYAEAVLRGGSGGDAATALQYVNLLRERAYGSTAGNITSQDLTLGFVIDERARELYWEAHRRTDLIRFGIFHSGDYLWAWKGAVREGRPVDAKFNLYPLPAADVIANPNLIQNTDY